MRWCSAIVAVWAVAAAWAGPQHWGFGFSYLVTLETDATGERALSVYEPPLFVRDDTWLLRWRDASGTYGDVLENGLAVGDFWPDRLGAQEYVALLVRDSRERLAVRVLAAPACFGTDPWTPFGRTLPLEGTPGNVGTPTEMTAGDVLGRGHDQVIVWYQNPRSKNPPSTVAIYDPPADPADGAWTLAALVSGAAVGHASFGLAAGDFWGEGRDYLATFPADPDLTIAVYAIGTPETGDRAPRARAELVASAPWQPADLVQNFVAADFLKDGFAYVATAAPDSPAWTFATAPKRADRPYQTSWVRSDETFAGARLAGQKPGECRRIMTGVRETPFGSVWAAGAGRVFGYVDAPDNERKEKLFKPWKYVGHDDVEVAFVHRTPMYRLGVPKRWQDGDWPWEPDEHYGWPLAGEDVVYEVNVKNNGPAPIPAGQVTLRAWIDTPHRNADTRAANAADPVAPAPADLSFTIDEPIPPFDPARPEYTTVKVPVKWPFALVQPEGWTWKKINVREVGERWMIVRLDYAADENRRNNRYEWALNSLLLRPVIRFDVDAPPYPTEDGLEGRPERRINTFAYRAPVVRGDPESKEYYGRKLADAVQCMWERSRTSDRGPVWQRIVLDSYRPYDTQGRDGLKPLNRADDWSYYEGPRENEHWLGLWGSYERFDATDGGAELHETGHLFHRIGDLYHYFINPINLRTIRLADGDPVQMYTYAWGLDSFCSGHAIIGEATCDLHRHLEGARYGLGFPWHRMLPDRVRVRVLDRDGEPVSGAHVQLWLHPQNTLHEEGTTGPDGTLPLSFPAPPGEERTFTLFDPFNIKLWDGRAVDSLAQVFTVALPGYTDFGILGSEETDAHSRYTLMHRSLTHRDGWTWDLHTLYKAGAPQPDFELTAAVQGREITLRMAGAPPRYRVYRRWEPRYAYERIAEVAPQGLSAREARIPFATYSDDIGAADWLTRGRYRAAYYVTAVEDDGSESLPRRVYGIAMDRVTGISDLEDGRLMVALNCGRSEPFGVICQGTTPAEEAVKHFRFGHTAAKIVASHASAQRYFATLLNSDMNWGAQRSFDLIQFDRPDRHTAQYPVLQVTAECDVTDFTTDTPYAVTIRPDRDGRALIHPGDWALVGDSRARILAVEGEQPADAGRDTERPPLTLTLDKALFEAGQTRGLHVRIEYGGGTPGERAELRELDQPRGLAVLAPADRRPTDPRAERIVIADTGNRRIVLWDGTTRYVAQWRPAGAEGERFHPVAVAAAPGDPTAVYVLDRQTGGQSLLHRVELADDAAPAESQGFPIAVPVSRGADDTEMGLAVAEYDGRLLAAITDAEHGRVLELSLPAAPHAAGAKRSAASYERVATHTRPIGVHAGDEKLVNPTDVAYTIEGGALALYCVDGHNRVVRLR